MYTEWRRKKWTTMQFVNIIYINCHRRIQTYGLGGREGVGSRPLLSPPLGSPFPAPPLPIPSPPFRSKPP